MASVAKKSEVFIKVYDRCHLWSRDPRYLLRCMIDVICGQEIRGIY